MTGEEAEPVYRKKNGTLTELDPSAPDYTDPRTALSKTHFIGKTKRGSLRLSYTKGQGFHECPGSLRKPESGSILIEDDGRTGLCEECDFYVEIESL